jgi:hypothetical protein
MLVTPFSVSAQAALVDPKNIALSPADLLPGFSVDRDELTPLPNGGGVVLHRLIHRLATPENIASGPLVVGQIIARIDDRSIAPIDLLTPLKAEIMQGLPEIAETSDGPNDRDHFSLVYRSSTSVIYAYGLTTSQFVLATFIGGDPAATHFADVIALGNVSVARIEAGPSAEPVASCPFVKGSGPSIFQLAGGQKHLLPDWDTFLARGGDPDLKNVCSRSDTQLDAIPTGDPVPTGR